MNHRHRCLWWRCNIDLLKIGTAVGTQVFDNSCMKADGELDEWRSARRKVLVRITKFKTNSPAYFFASKSPSLCNNFFTIPQSVFFRRWTLSSLLNWYKHRIEPLDICEPSCTTHFRIFISLSGDTICVDSLITERGMADKIVELASFLFSVCIQVKEGSSKGHRTTSSARIVSTTNKFPKMN
jgi:hypothetical protein